MEELVWLKVHRSGGDPKTPMSCRPPPKESTQPSQHYLGLGSRKTQEPSGVQPQYGSRLPRQLLAGSREVS